MTPSNDLRVLANSCLNDSTIAIDDFAVKLIVIASEEATVECKLRDTSTLEFVVNNDCLSAIPTGRALSKLRALCAAVATICRRIGQLERNFSPYGGKALLTKGSVEGQLTDISVTFQNTPEKQYVIMETQGVRPCHKK